jgi:hypothetical protein
MARVLAALAGAVLIASVSGAQNRDPSSPPPTTSRIAGRVVAADDGRPLRRAIVRLSAAETGAPRTTITDEGGRYEFRDLPGGRYSLTAARVGFVTLSYGQTRPLESGTPIELRAGQAIEKVDIALPRGSVIAGRIVDEAGEPVAGAQVRVMQFRYAKGQRRLTPTGAVGTTWDTGEFRIWSLMPGEYTVTATLRDAAGSGDVADPSGYAPSYYPGTPNAAEAQTLEVGLGETVEGVLVTLVPARLARVSGTAIDSAGERVRAGVVMALQRSATLSFATSTAEIRADGTFEMSGLVPAEYILRAAAPGTDPPETLSATVAVDGQDVAGVILGPVQMASVTGRITFDPPGQAPPPAAIRLSVEPLNPEPIEFLPGAGSAAVADDFTFELSAPPGEMIIRAAPAASAAGWVLKAVRHNSRDVTDTGLQFFSGTAVEGVDVIMTSRVQEVSGVVRNAKGELVTACTVFVFPQDPDRWVAGGRHMAIGRPDQEGRYRLGTLPPGEYFAVAAPYIDENRGLGDPVYLEALSAGATRFTLREGETRSLDLELAATRSPR